MRGQRLLLSIVIGAIAGAVVGTFLPDFAVHLKFLGEFFLNALKMMVLPLIVTSLVVGVTGVGDAARLGSLGIRTFVYYIATTCVAVFIGICIVQFFQPGVGMTLVEGADPEKFASKSVTAVEMLLRFIHPNLVEAAANFNLLPLITASILFGAALVALGKRAKPAVDMIKLLNDAVMQVIHWIILITPIGVFGLIAYRLGLAGGGDEVTKILMQLGKYCLTVILGLLIHGIFVLPFILYIFTHRSPFNYFSKCAKAVLTAFATASSSATLPVTMECVKEEAKVDEETTDVVLPIGATVNMDGTALYEAVAVIFIAQAYGISLGLGELVIIFITANLASIGAASIPEAGLVTMVLVLQSVGLPVEGIGLILAVDWFLDRCRTTVNVWGDAVGAAVISRFSRPISAEARKHH